MSHPRSLVTSLLAAVLAMAGCHNATPRATPTPQQVGGPGRDTTKAATTPPAAPNADPIPKAYDKVVTAAAKSKSGLFKTHQIGSKLYFELPATLLGKELLVVPRVSKAPEGGPYGGQQVASTAVLRWERRENRVLLRAVTYNIVADSSKEIASTVYASTFAPVLASYPVEAYGTDSAAVIDVTRLFTAPPAEIGPGATLRGSLDATRSMIERVTTFPTNVEVEALLSASAPPTPNAPTPSPFFPQGGQFPGSSSLVMHWSIVRLPDVPMMPRLADSRVGYFTTDKIDYSNTEQRTVRRSYITRYRLEKKDPTAAISEPVRPIVYYVDPATPKWLVPYIKRGIEAWQPAFEAAGFRNAIIAREGPTAAQDPEWSPEDARYSVIRWLPSPIANAQGPNVHDPRSGEILEADVYMYHNIMELQRIWYFSQVGHLDPRARMWPFPDSLMGRLVEYVVAHEVGHTLGFQHNHKASSTYPIDSLRSPSWIRRMGHTPTLMDYSRFNYLAQPEDHIPVADLVPGIGPYDLFATHWGYAPIPGARTTDDERPTLNGWAREQDSTPWFRFNVPGSNGSDPGDQAEAVGDGDPVKATTWGTRSLRQIAPLLREAAERPDRDYADLAQLYNGLVNQWRTELGHVATDVGGTYAQEKHGDQAGVRFTPLPPARQQAAVRFLIANAFETPTFFLLPEVLRRIETEGALRRISQAQNAILTGLFNDRRMERMIEYAALAPSPRESYPLAQMLAEVRGGIWRELGAGRVVVDPFRRELQRAHLALLRVKAEPPTGGAPVARATSDVRSLMRAELRALDTTIRTALDRAADRETRAHLEDVRDEIDRILRPR